MEKRVSTIKRETVITLKRGMKFEPKKKFHRKKNFFSIEIHTKKFSKKVSYNFKNIYQTKIHRREIFTEERNNKRKTS